MFAYQPAALGDILLAHKSFDVLRRALAACCWERRKLAGAADVSIARCLCLCRWQRRRRWVPVKPDYGCPQPRSQSLPTPARVLLPALLSSLPPSLSLHCFSLRLSLSHLTILEDLMKKAKPKTTKGVAKFQHCLNHHNVDAAPAPPLPLSCNGQVSIPKTQLIFAQFAVFDILYD